MLKIFKKILNTCVFCLLLTACAVTQAMAADVTLAWNTVPEALGYKIYWGPASRTYTGTGIAKPGTTLRLNNIISTLTVSTAVNSPMDVLNISMFTFTLDPGVYYFSVTAYNNWGESGYSTEVNTAIISITPGNTKDIHVISLILSPIKIAYLNNYYLTNLN